MIEIKTSTVGKLLADGPTRLVVPLDLYGFAFGPTSPLRKIRRVKDESGPYRIYLRSGGPSIRATIRGERLRMDKIVGAEREQALLDDFCGIEVRYAEVGARALVLEGWIDFDDEQLRFAVEPKHIGMELI